MMVEDNQKIWRYMSLGKFISLLQEQALYFTRYCNFPDPLEGKLPRAHTEALRHIHGKYYPSTDDLNELQKTTSIEAFNKYVASINEIKKRAAESIKAIDYKFGVTCWKIHETECAAMWSFVPKDSVCVVSTIGRLKQSLPMDLPIIYEPVRYANFETAEIEKGYQHYHLFMKDSPYQYENEYRAALLLEKNNDQENVKCSVNTLIDEIYVSPYSGGYLYNVVRNLAIQAELNGKLIQKSSLLSKERAKEYKLVI